MTTLRRRNATTTVTYDATDARPIPDLGVTRGSLPFRTFTPTTVTVTADWANGPTIVDLSGPAGQAAIGGSARFELGHYNDAADHPERIVRDAVGQACSDHDAGNI